MFSCRNQSLAASVLAYSSLLLHSEASFSESALLAEDGKPGVEKKALNPQYEGGSIAIPGASPDEEIITFSSEKGNQYVRDGALAWTASKGCISCHTTGQYGIIAPRLTESFGKPLGEVRELLVEEAEELLGASPEDRMKGIVPARIAVLASGLVSYDRASNEGGKLSDETKRALNLLVSVVNEEGSIRNEDCWPPYESSNYQSAITAAIAIAEGAEWRKGVTDKDTLESIGRLEEYLKENQPPHNYGKLLKLWAGSKNPAIISPEERKELIKMVFSLQNSDGGWSIRDFAAPEEWGSGNRAAYIRSMIDAEDPRSDGHQTGLAILVLREAGISSEDERIQGGITWIKSNQRASGRWWTPSLNTPNYHFSTYSGTLYPLYALQLCGELSPKR